MKRSTFTKFAVFFAGTLGINSRAIAAPVARNGKLTDKPRRSYHGLYGPGNKNPMSTANQLIYTAIFASQIAKAISPADWAKLIAAIGSGDFGTAAEALKNIGNIDLIKRLFVVLGAHQNYPVHAFGYYATILISNPKTGTDGWKCPDPEGSPYGEGGAA